jgi:outer membrane receptor protein involved in Fe transport
MLSPRLAHNRRNVCLAALFSCLVLVLTASGQTPADQDLMSLSIEELAKTKVFSASRQLEDTREAPSAVSIITADDIARYGWRTLADALRSLRGFYTAYDRDYVYLGVRGFLRSGDYNSRILLLVNGHRLNDNVFGSAAMGTEFPLDLDLIDRIEVVRGPSSSLFGTNAVFGVVNVITRQSRSDTTIEIAGETSSFLGRAGSLTAGVHKGSWSALLSGGLYHDPGPNRLFFPEFAAPESNGGVAQDRDGDHYGHIFADLHYKDFRLQGMFSRRAKMVPTASYGTNFNDYGSSTTDTAGSLDASYHRGLSPSTDLDLRLYYDSYESYGTGAFGGSDPDSRFLGIADAQVDSLGAEATLGYQLGRHRITLGADYEHTVRLGQKNHVLGQPPIVDSHHTPWRVATYGEAKLSLVPKVTLNAGARVDYFDICGGALSPRLALIYTPDSRTALKYILSRAFRAPNAYESYYEDTLVLAAPTTRLEPEHIQSHELVFERRVLPWLGLTLDGFYNGLTNLIDEVPDPASGLNHFVNSGKDTGRGIEFELEAKRPSGLTARASYTLADARDSVNHMRLANSPLHKGQVNTIIPVTRRGFAGLEMLYFSAQRSYQDTRVSPSFLTNLTFSTKPLWGGWEFSVSGYNLFDRRWYSPVGPEHVQDQIQQDGRTYRFKLTYRFRRERGK